MAELPFGTVTFLFTDVEGSTRLLDELGAEGYAAALAEHRLIVREACGRHGGVEVDTQGDAFFVAFPTAPGALRAAAELTGALEPGPIRVRVGLHTGTPLVTSEGYVGADVHRAARIAAAGHGGQVLVSAATAALVAGDGLVDLGEHRFKDLAAAERVFQLGEGAFPPLKSLYRSNLPVPSTPFLGRERELAEVVELLTREDVRLLTLTGPGGTGKTRLALQAAAEAEERFPDGITWVPLAPLRDGELVASAIVQGFGLLERAGAGPLELVVETLAGRRALLVLDNAEHLLAGVVAVVRAILDRCPLTTTIVTSRERLQLQAEHLWAVPPLERSDGIALFTARARQLDPSFGHSSAVDELCDRLEGLPLALELAAARIGTLSAEQLLDRLGGRLDLLRGGRDVDVRQRTLRATIDWSYELLDAEQQRVFRSLSVFAGGCTLEAVEQVCGADLELVESLVDKSLLRRRSAASGPRFWMLETIRELAAERLADAGERERLASRHSEYYRQVLSGQVIALRELGGAAFAIVDDELANARTAIAAAIERADAGALAGYLRALWFYWLVGGHGREAQAAARAWQRLPAAGLEPATRFSAALAASEIERYAGSPATAIALKLGLLELARANPGHMSGGRPIESWTVAVHTDLAHLLVDEGNLEEARVHGEEALAARRRDGHPFGIGHALQPLAEIADAEGDYLRAAKLRYEIVELFDRAGYGEEAAFVRASAAETEVLLGRGDRAAAEIAAAAAAARGTRDLQGLAIVLRAGAHVVLATGNGPLAGALFAAALRLGERTGVTFRTRTEIARDAAALLRLREELEPAELAAAEQAGAESDPDVLLERVVALAPAATAGS